MINYEAIKELIIYLFLNPIILYTCLGIEIFLILLFVKIISRIVYYDEGRETKNENN